MRSVRPSRSCTRPASRRRPAGASKINRSRCQPSTEVVVAHQPEPAPLVIRSRVRWRWCWWVTNQPETVTSAQWYKSSNVCLRGGGCRFNRPIPTSPPGPRRTTPWRSSPGPAHCDSARDRAVARPCSHPLDEGRRGTSESSSSVCGPALSVTGRRLGAVRMNAPQRDGSPSTVSAVAARLSLWLAAIAC